MIALLLIFISTLHQAHAQEDGCKYFKYCGSNAPQTSSQSLPSSSVAANFNPSNIARAKGVGLEILYQPNNPLGYSVVTGNGKLGAALISSSGENSFFGNRALEIDEVYLQRRLDKKRYKNKKIHLALGRALLNRRHMVLDLGVSLKRNPEIKRLNPGIGFSGRLAFLNFGFYTYRDDVKINLDSYLNPYLGIPYSEIYGSDTYQENYTVQTFTLGTKISSLALDFGMIKSQYNFYPDETIIKIYSLSYNLKKVLFNFGYRNENSSQLKEVDGLLVQEKIKNDIYGGVQFFINPHLTVGLGYNQFLLNETSASVTLFL